MCRVHPGRPELWSFLNSAQSIASGGDESLIESKSERRPPLRERPGKRVSFLIEPRRQVGNDADPILVPFGQCEWFLVFGGNRFDAMRTLVPAGSLAP